MSRTFYKRLIVTLFLVFVARRVPAVGRVPVPVGVTFTTPSWDNISFGYPVNISWTELPHQSGSADLELGTADSRTPESGGVTLNAESLPWETKYWIWIPKPQLFGDSMSQWSPDRLWRVSLIPRDEDGFPDPQLAARSPEFHIFLDNGQITTSTSTITTATTTRASAISTNHPETDHAASHDHLSPGAIAEIAIGCLVVVVAVIIVFAILRHRRKTQERQLTLFTGSAVNTGDGGHKSRVNIADMIPDFPSPAPTTAVGTKFQAEKHDPSPAYELDGVTFPSTNVPASPLTSAQLPDSTSPPAELPGSTSPVGSPPTLTAPRSPEPSVPQPESIVPSTSNGNKDWTYDPVRGGYMGPNVPIAMPDGLPTGEEQPAPAPGAVLEHPVYQSVYRPASGSGPSRRSE